MTERWQSKCSDESHEGLLWCLDQIGDALEKLDMEHPDSRAKTPPMMWVEWLHCVLAQKVDAAVGRERERCAQLCEDHGHSNGRIRGSHKHLAAAIRQAPRP